MLLGQLFRGLVLSLIAFGSSCVQAEDKQFVGSEQCVDCHQAEVEAWKGSHHELAMQHASSESVLADFNDHRFVFNGKENRFFKKGNEFWVYIENQTGEFKEYKISYTFGVDPLQQYMVEFDDGRVQLIPFAWDSRREQEGGQRWFHLYPDMKPHDEFYWTNAGQNWNFMCADCHSTNLQKNYDTQTNRYSTTWSEINVGCEACHGPASDHVTQANLNVKNQSSSWQPHYGFDRDLKQSVANWVYKEGHSTLQPSEIVSTNQVRTCAQCHSRRTQLNETKDHVKGSFLDRYRLSLITPELYHHDGQIYDENYVYGSYLQSAMAEKGVTCTNCHDPHSATLKIPEEAVCSQCHIASEYTSEKHTFHEAGTEASKCTTCHMPETTYMQVDPRRDHSWHVPRPDLSQHIQTPNVCTSCHEDKDNQWATKQLAEWFPQSEYQNQQHFSVAFYAGSIGHKDAGNALAYTAQNLQESPIIRASSLERLSGTTGKNTLVSLARAVKHENALIRLGAVAGSAGYSFTDRWQILEPLLNDPVLSIRTEAAGSLVTSWHEMNPLQRETLQPALDEYIEVQMFNSDRGFGRTNLANVYRSLGQLEKAKLWYRGAIEIEPYFEASYINYADLYRAMGKEKDAQAVLLQGQKANPDSSSLPYSYGLSLFREGQTEQATAYLKQAAETAQNNDQYWYVYGLAAEKQNVRESNSALEQAYKISRNPEQLYARCEVLARNSSDRTLQFAFDSCLRELGQFAPPNVITRLRALSDQSQKNSQ